MAGYKDEEIESAVSRFVQSTIRIEKDALGPVDIGSKFNEVLQLISSTLVYDPNAIFYVIYLATNRLNVVVETAIEYVEDILEAIDELGYNTKEVTRTTLLGDAAAALLTVDQILTDKNAISSRAFTRYKEAVDGFTVASLEPNIKKASQIVRPPQLARTDLLTSIASLSDSYADILDTLSQIRKMLEEFNELNLGVVSIQDSVRKVREDLRTLQSQFEDTSTSRDTKIALCRSAYLSLASGKSVLNNFVTVSDPSDPRLVSSASIVGRPEVPAGSEGVLTLASVTGTKSAPWEVVTGSADQLKVAEDGGSEKTYTFTPPSQPSVTSGLDENWDQWHSVPVAYNIQAGVTDRLEIDGLPTVLLTAGTNRTALQIAADINAWAVAGPYPYSATNVAIGGLQFVQITKTTPGATEIRMTAEDATYRTRVLATYVATGFYEGQSDSSTGISAAEAAEEINSQGYISAEVERTVYESGEGGTVVTSTLFRVPENTFAALGHVDDMLVIRSGVNAGYYRITVILRAGGFDNINISPATPFRSLGTADWVVVRELLTLTSKTSDLSTELVVGAGNANSIFGFTPGTTVGTTTGFRAAENGTDVDFSRLDVVLGDVVRIADPVPVATEHTVVELSANNRQLELDPPLPTDLTVSSFRILSAAVVEYEDFDAAADSWYIRLNASKFKEDILELGRVINPLLSNKNPSLALLNDARSTALELKSLLTDTSPDGLTEILKAFQVTTVPRIDAALKMLLERGMDRAYDLLMDGQISTFFGMDKDDASSSAFMLKSMRSVVQADLPLSKLEEDADDIIHADLVEDTDADYDYSDADDDENVSLLGEVPDFDNADDEAATSRSRY